MNRLRQKDIYVGQRRRPAYRSRRRLPLWLRNTLNIAVRLLILAALAAGIVLLVRAVADRLFAYEPQAVADRFLNDQPPVPEQIARALAVERESKRIQDAREAGGYVPAFGEVPGLYVKDGVKTCYLTFDDGPSAVTDQILDVLASENVKATFFMLGSNVEKYPDKVRRVFEAGHSIGSHSYSHDYQKLYKSDNCVENFQQELLQTQEAINHAIGQENPNRILRFPGGSFEAYKQPIKEMVVAEGFRHIDWNALNGDAEKQNPSADYLMNAIRKTSYNREDIVVLMHDAPAKKITAQTLPQIIAYLREQGYAFRPITYPN